MHLEEEQQEEFPGGHPPQHLEEYLKAQWETPDSRFGMAHTSELKYPNIQEKKSAAGKQKVNIELHYIYYINESITFNWID